MTDTRRPERVGHVKLKGRGTMPILVGGTEVLGLNETALAIWDLCDGGTSVDEMVEAVIELTGLEAVRARADVGGVIDEFERLGIVTQSHGAGHSE